MKDDKSDLIKFILIFTTIVLLVVSFYPFVIKLLGL